MTEWILDDRKLQELIAKSPDLVDQAIRATAQDVRGKAVGNIQSMDAIDTGATMNSVFVKDNKTNGYSEAASKAQGARPDSEPVDGTPEAPGPMTAYVSAATNYAIWIELGSSRNQTPPKPFLSQATETADTSFEKYIRKVLGE